MKYQNIKSQATNIFQYSSARIAIAVDRALIIFTFIDSLVHDVPLYSSSEAFWVIQSWGGWISL